MLGGCYTALAVQKIHGKMSLQQRTGNWTKDDEVRTSLGEWNSDVIYIQMKVEKETYRTFYVGTTEEIYSLWDRWWKQLRAAGPVSRTDCLPLTNRVRLAVR